MKSLNWLLVVSFVSFCGASALAAEENFEKGKSEALSELDQRIQKLQENRTCMSAAANRDAMKKCHESMKDWREGKKHEMMEKKQMRMEERMKERSEAKKPQ